MDESIAAGELRRIIDSVAQTVGEYEEKYIGTEEEIEPTKEPQKTLMAYAKILTDMLFTKANVSDNQTEPNQEWGSV